MHFNIQALDIDTETGEIIQGYASFLCDVSEIKAIIEVFELVAGLEGDETFYLGENESKILHAFKQSLNPYHVLPY